MAQDDEATFSALIASQEHSFDNIKSLVANYGKDSADRKTLSYLEKRINALDYLWGEFKSNNKTLLEFYGSKGEHEYFKKNVYQVAEKMYNETMSAMSNLRVEKQGDPEPKPNPNEQHQSSDDETGKRRTALLRQQICNFNALERAVSKVNLDTMMEKWQLQDQLTTLKSKWEPIDKSHWELSYLLQGENKPYHDKFDYWERTYDELKEEIGRKIWETSHYEKSTPKIELPEFSGAYNNWVSFRDLFYEMIHNNPTLNKTEKMKYLKSKLRGEAEKLIKHLSVSADNYDSCLDIISHRYDNKRLLFTSYLELLLNQSSIDKPNSANMKKLHDTTRECVNALNNIGIDTPVWGPLLVHLLSSKLDDVTYGDYIENMQNPRELPDLEEFLEFLELKFMTLETARNKRSCQKPNYPSYSQHKNSTETKSMNFNKAEKWTKSFHAAIRNCPLCKGGHALRQCESFLKMDVATRNLTTNNLKICKNCLFSHGGNKCISASRCRECKYRHHTLLHDENKGQRPSSLTASGEKTSNHINSDDQEILLTTLQLRVQNSDGEYVILRALLDQGSQVTLITEKATQRLNLPRSKLNAAVTGVGTIMGTSKGMIKLECKSIHSEYSFQTEALVMRKLINNLPNVTINTDSWRHLDNIKLADPTFNISGPIDILLGADIYSEVILEGILKQDHHSHVAQQTKLGWILCGATKQFNCLVTLNDQDNFSRFWEIEDIPSESQPTNEDEYCEKYYLETTERLRNGRYVIKMPMEENYEQNLGKSRSKAIAQFRQLEKKMMKQTYFAKLYRQFVKDYQDLGHMKPSLPSQDTVEVFLPHHGVLRESSTTTKLRAVFNASMKTDSGHSLNDLMKKGPNLQKDILSLIIKWRSHKYVLTADIEKMYRQILIHQDQQSLQKIFWRESTNDKLQEMQLCTLTYGTKVAPFIAMRTLLQLATDEGNAYPLAQKALRNDFYMDDVITGHHTIETTKLLQTQLYELLKKGGFILRKWASNEPTVLEQLQEKEKSTSNDFNFNQKEFSKTLGLVWDNKSDAFRFNSENLITNESNYTKRKLLSEISSIYDPIGWLAPMTIQAKLIFQKLWREKYQHIEWDDTLPSDVTEEWLRIKAELHEINKINVPRWIQNNNKSIEIQAFCDASENAYACVIYSRTKSSDGAHITTLLTAKTKVAPLKTKTTIPRLELCGAVLLSKLLQKVMKALADYDLKISCWTDSKVVLAWLQGKQSRWEKYITNRTQQITNIISAKNWGYVKSSENPADCATRGLSPAKLVTFSLWWEGPQWLKEQEKQAEVSTDIYTTKEGLVKNCFATEPAPRTNELINLLLERHSDMSRITRILAWTLRFVDTLRNKTRSIERNELSLHEINKANCLIIRSVQTERFEKELVSLKESGKLPNKSPILKLNPYVDSNRILRVGGRLELSSLPMETKHPILIPHDGRLTQLIIEKAHQKTLHGGARLTLAYTRNSYWIVGGNRAVKKTLRQCVRCHRFKVSRNEQLMGNLPKERITPSRPFTYTGVDYTGHVEVKINKGRGIKTSKGYIAIFICMSTKAVHIELVSDLSTETFIAALKRMCARRGTPKHIYSDNGTNFVGAAKVLNDEFVQYKTMLSTDFFKEINDLQIEWHFNAPAWPSAGGLWEAAVRSMKSHLKRVIGQQKLTYEQFSTLLSQIEACMNSRPLCPLSEDIDDLDYLTPGHFLTGRPTLELPLNEPQNLKSIDLRNNWKLIELMRRHHWDRWSQEYLHSVQNRNKWQQTKENLKKGQLVLIKENNLPPGKWAMGRVVELHPGSDGLVRVVTLKTQNGVLKRPIIKLAPLPMTETINNIDTEPERPQSEAKNPNEERKKKRETTTKRHNKVNSLLMVLLVALTTIYPARASNVQNFKITPLTEKHPIYFDPVGNIQLIHDEWKLLVFYNLTTLWQSTTKVEEFINHLDQICETMPKEQCHATIRQLRFEMNHIKEYNKLLLSQHQQRKRRGYVDGIGNLARTLFGVLDSEFAHKYVQDIEKIQTNEHYLLELIKNQTIIIESENNVIKRNEDFVNKQFDIIHQYMQSTQHDMSMLQNRAQIMSVMNDVNAGAITASLLLSVLKRSQDMLLDTLTDIYKGHLNRNLFTPEQLVEQLNYIAGLISKRLTLPTKNCNEIDCVQNIYKLIYVKARLTAQYLLFELHIPLLSDDEYTLYHNIPIQRQLTNDQCQVIMTTSKYIAVNFVKNNYIQIEDADLQHCTTVMADNYICHAYTPISSLHGVTASCEAKMLSQNVNITCNWATRQCMDQWRKLHRPNIWLYDCNTKCPIRIVCENHITTTIITKAGLLALDQDCIIQHKDSTIYSYNVFGSKIKTGITLEVPTIDSPNEMLDTYKNTEILLPRLNMSAEHSMIEKGINSQKEREILPRELSIHDIGNYAISSMLVGGIIITLIIGKLRKHLPNCKKNKNLPVTSSRIRSTEPTRTYREKVDNQIEIQEIPEYAQISKQARHTPPPKPRRTGFNV